MPCEPLSEYTPASSWMSRNSCNHNRLQLLEIQALFVINPLEIDQLPQQLDGGMGAPLLLHRHVDVVHHHHQVLPRRRRQVNVPLLPLLHKFVLQTLLDRLAARLSAETHFHVADVRLHFYRAFNYYRFPSSTYTRYEYVALHT
jgi:hypothetical protein